MTNFWDSLELLDETEVTELEYLLYYDENGCITCYSMELLAGDTNYIKVNKNTYNAGRYDIIIEDGEIVKPTEYIYQKIVPSNNGTKCSSDVSIIGNEQYWELKRYE
jgi:hypothetical protein